MSSQTLREGKFLKRRANTTSRIKKSRSNDIKRKRKSSHFLHKAPCRNVSTRISGSPVRMSCARYSPQTKPRRPAMSVGERAQVRWISEYLNHTSCWSGQFLVNFLCTIIRVSGSKVRPTPETVGMGMGMGTTMRTRGSWGLVYHTYLFLFLQKNMLAEMWWLSSFSWLTSRNPNLTSDVFRETRGTKSKYLLILTNRPWGSPHNEKPDHFWSPYVSAHQVACPVHAHRMTGC